MGLREDVEVFLADAPRRPLRALGRVLLYAFAIVTTAALVASGQQLPGWLQSLWESGSDGSGIGSLPRSPAPVNSPRAGRELRTDEQGEDEIHVPPRQAEDDRADDPLNDERQKQAEADAPLGEPDKCEAQLLSALQEFEQKKYQTGSMAIVYQKLVDAAADSMHTDALKLCPDAIRRASEARAALDDSDQRFQALDEAVAAFDQDRSEQNRGRVRTLYEQLRDLDRDRARVSPEKQKQEIIQRAHFIVRGISRPDGLKPVISLQEHH